ncbi:trypsin-1-like isoform X1 [Biomphalaria glabrata]|uniref:Trypsin-1-like isoform X1 n=1 Tax=Biomphalaria glabrata TaxID=6526 RepID=A0A9W2ZZH9_BIOGL|nr:trypsin-1-like isoform X1 [Biomphalaria glabrata]
MRHLVCLLLVWTLANVKPSTQGQDLIRLVRSRYDQIDAPGCGLRPLATGNGASEITARIVGGQEAIPYSHPSICSLRMTTSPTHHFCGGTLVKNLAGEYHFITAAHCVNGEPRPSRYEAHCGIHDRTDTNEPHRVIVYFSSLTSHPSYDAWTMDYDIAVFKVATALPTNTYVSPACIPNEGWFEGEKGLAVGWGSLTSGGDAHYMLHQVVKPIKSRETCELRYGAGSVTLRMFCAGLPQGGVDSCQFDSGGPFYTYRENRWTLAGIISWGYGCAEAGRPGVYTDIIELKDWINSIINVA